MSAWWREWAASAALPAEIRDGGELCLNEVVANIIQHGGEVRAIEITLETDADGVRMTIADDGKPFDPATYPAARLPRTLHEACPGGLGINIVRGFSASLAYARIDNRNRLTVTLT
jgi:serine/threonine-protein kinase RsbW